MNKKYTYEIGTTYNLVKLIELYKDKSNKTMAKVECVLCGKIKNIRPYELYKDKQTSCMCQNVKHNLWRSKIYSVYHNMKDRCYNPKCHAYKNYGGKGVKICDEWLDNFINFYNWAMNNGYKEGLSIDRINVDGNYEPSNCRWITLSKNVAYANKTNVRRKAEKGEYYGISPYGEYFQFDNASQFAREHNLNANNVRDVANKRKKSHKGWKFGFINEK
jgi:hypothetical protein